MLRVGLTKQKRRRQRSLGSDDFLQFLNLLIATMSTFEEAVAAIGSWKPANQPSNDEKLAIYALYKQATVGDCNTSRPGMMDFTGKAKWDAWNAKKGVSQDDAKAQYIAEVARQMAAYQ
ncbi:Aste57867_22321 [Aphanomyces stellatus]|uniref:Aste57867_22321 protein n=1 Tax=Aphanomyces stellatus TaxID=120398 RepID=A0A485LLQ6_9STRA|nr:hypothetical protein As57867_022251 [Aphanomyces stellatus]VFT98985.1 Aste57867_22321 [Aphanomyces stellatus]